MQIKQYIQFISRRLLLFLVIYCYIIKPSFAQENDTAIVYKVKDNIACLYGFKNENKEWVVQPKYTEASNFISGFSIIGDGLHYGVLNEYGRIVVPVKYDEIMYLRNSKTNGSYMANEEQLDEELAIPGYFRVRKDDSWGIIKEENKVVLPVIYSDVQNFENGFGIILSNDNLFGFCDTSGKIISPAYDEVRDFSNTYFLSENNLYFAIVIKNKKWGLINESGKLIVPILYDYIQEFNSQGLAYVNIGSKVGLINQRGNILNAEYDDIDKSDSNYIVFKKGKKYGIANNKGEYIVQEKFDSLWSYYRSVTVFKKNGRCGLLNKADGKVLLKNKFQSIDELYNLKLLLVKKKDKYGLIDNRGNILLAPEFDAYTYDNYVEEYICFIKNKKVKVISTKDYKEKPITECLLYTGKIARLRNNWGTHSNGLVDKEGNILLDPRYIIEDYQRVAIFESKDGEMGAINDSGYIIAPLGKYKDIQKFENGYAIVKSKNNKLGIIDINGKLILDTAYYGIAQYDKNEKSCWVIPAPPPFSKDESDSIDWCKAKYGLVDSNGHYIHSPIYDFPVTFENDLAVASTDMSFGVIDNTGKTVLSFIYDKISGERNNELFILTLDGICGIANSKGELILPPRFDEINSFENGYARVKYNDQYGLIDSVGNILINPYNDSFQNSKIVIENLKYPDFELTDPGKEIESNNQFYYKSMHSIYHNTYFDLLTNYYNKNTERIVNNTILLAVADYANDEDNSYGLENCLYKYKVYSLRGNYDISRYDYRETISYHLKLRDITNFSFTEEIETIEEYRRANYTYTFKTYIIQNNKTYIITLDSLFNTEIDYSPTLNNFIVEEIKTRDDLEMDCTNPEKYIETLAENFGLSPDGLSFYIANNTNEEGMAEHVRITIPYYKLKSIIRTDGLIANIIKDKNE